MLFYHATDMKNLGSIMSNGIKANNIENAVFLTDNPESSAKFLVVRGHKNIVSIAVDLEEDTVQESYDHNYAFFKCKAYVYQGDIPVDKIRFDKSMKYEL